MTTDATAPPPSAPRGDVISLPQSALLGALPGLLFGAYVTGLLFFLNPEIAPTAPSVARGVVLYGGMFGAISSLLALTLVGRSTRRARKLLPWLLTLVLVLAAASTWFHAYRYAYYLPAGINVRLVKAAVTLSLAGLLAFMTSLLHTLDDRRYGLRSRLLFAVLSVAVLYVMVERRVAFDPPPAASPLASLTSYRSRPELWVIGLEGATLDAILPLAEQGRLPFFSQLLASGTSVRIESVPSATRAALWTTLATGRRPDRHRIVTDRVYPAGTLGPGRHLLVVPPGYAWWGFFGGDGQPVDASHRQFSAIWEILTRLDVTSGVIGWPAAVPPWEPVAYAFSDRFFRGDLLSAATRPYELAERGVLFRVPPEEIDPALLSALGEPLSFPFLQALADDVWRESLAGFLLDQRSEVDAVFLRLEGLADVSSRYYGAFASVEFGGAQDRDRQDGARLVSTYYRHLDRFLAELSARPGPDRVLALVSPDGFDRLRGWRRLAGLSGERALRGSRAGAPDGMLLLHGPGVRGGERLPDAKLIDVLPTLLYSVGLPIARDLDGRVLTGAFETAYLARQPLTFVPSYETLELEVSPGLGPELLAPAGPGSDDSRR